LPDPKKFVAGYYRHPNYIAMKIRYNCRNKFIGYFKDEIHAAKAYDRAAKKYHGEFASLNFPP